MSRDLTTPVGQLALDLRIPNADSWEYFVVHSGVVDAVRVLEHALAELERSVDSGSTRFRQIVLEGGEGTGKSHLLRAIEMRAKANRLPDGWLEVIDLNTEFSARAAEDVVASFVSRYEAAQKVGALLLVEINSPAPVLDPELSKHLFSRLRAGEIVETSLPSESEVRAVVASVMERMNLRLPESAITYLETRLPLNPRSFTELLRVVDEVSLREGRRIGRQLVGRVLRSKGQEL